MRWQRRFDGRPVRVRPHLHRRFVNDEVIARARARLGENRYRILSNNCEHFCEWCVVGESRSGQIELWRMRALSILPSTGRLLGLRRLVLMASAERVRAADGLIRISE